MILQQRIDVLVELGDYMQKNSQEWQQAKEQANRINPWFVPEFIEMASNNIINYYLQRNELEKWVEKYKVPQQNTEPAVVGVVMAGNIPMVGFHDLLCI